MTVKGLGCTGVIDEAGNLAGIIADGDFRRHMNGGGGLDTSARDMMTRKPVVLEARSEASVAMVLMEKHSITSLFAMQDGKPSGIVHMHDCLRLRSGKTAKI